MMLGPRQIELLRVARLMGAVKVDKGTAYHSAMKLHARGLLKRDRADSYRFLPCPAGEAALGEIDRRGFARLGKALRSEIARQDDAQC